MQMRLRLRTKLNDGVVLSGWWCLACLDGRRKWTKGTRVHVAGRGLGQVPAQFPRPAQPPLQRLPGQGGLSFLTASMAFSHSRPIRWSAGVLECWAPYSCGILVGGGPGWVAGWQARSTYMYIGSILSQLASMKRSIHFASQRREKPMNNSPQMYGVLRIISHGLIGGKPTFNHQPTSLSSESLRVSPSNQPPSHLCSAEPPSCLLLTQGTRRVRPWCAESVRNCPRRPWQHQMSKKRARCTMGLLLDPQPSHLGRNPPRSGRAAWSK